MSKCSLHAAAALLGFALLGSAGVQASEVAHIVVAATQPWVSSGVSLNPGDIVSIRAVGSWKYNGDPNQPANGPDGEPIPLDANNRNAGALICMVGANPSFVVGEDFDFVTPSSWSGTLQFMINDGIPNLFDNSGALAVFVVVGAPSLVSVPPLKTGDLVLRLSSYPNPSSGEMEFAFDLSRAARVNLEVYDAGGRRVATVFSGNREAGRHTLRWNRRDETGSALPAGVYFGRIKAGDGTGLSRIVVLPE